MARRRQRTDLPSFLSPRLSLSVAADAGAATVVVRIGYPQAAEEVREAVLLAAAASVAASENAGKKRVGGGGGASTVMLVAGGPEAAALASAGLLPDRRAGPSCLPPPFDSRLMSHLGGWQVEAARRLPGHFVNHFANAYVRSPRPSRAG